MRKLLFLPFVFFLAVVSAQTLPPTKLTVSQDGSGDFTTIQEAVNSVRDLAYERVTILIKNGIYKEKLVIPSWKTMISLVGESREKTVITNGDYTGKDYPGKDPSGKTKFATYSSYTVLVEGNDFTAENLTIENSSGPVGQAVALHVEGDRVIIKDCTLLGHQDTLYTATENSRQYYENCFIQGTTDFIFGEATVIFRDCTMKSLTNSFVTAAATRPGHEFGYVLFNCRFITDTATKAYLGRPWRQYAKTVLINCDLGKHILPEGWNPWTGDIMFPDKDRTTYYAEYNSKGPGANPTKRIGWSKQLTTPEVARFTVQNIFKDWDPNKKKKPRDVQ